MLSSERTVSSKTGALSAPERSLRSLRESVRSLKGIVPLDLVGPLSPERTVQSSKRAVPSKTGAVSSAEWTVPSPEQLVPLDLVDSPFPERAVRSAKRAAPSKTGTLHTQAADGVVAGEARYAALAERSAQTVDRLLRRVSRHRAKGR